MAITTSGTSITFNDATTQTTGVPAPGTSGYVLTSNGTAWTSAAAGGTGVTSVATGNGLSGGTITTTGTLTIACPTFNSVGSYCFISAENYSGSQLVSGSNYSAGTGHLQFCSTYGLASSSSDGSSGNGAGGQVNNLSGTWKWMGAASSSGGDTGNSHAWGIACRVS
jgi:hypothetical protein